MTKLKQMYQELFEYSSVLQQLVTQQLILRYRRTFLGYLWTLINPLLMMSVMAVVFSTLFKADLKTFAVFLFTGMIPWNFFSTLVGQSGGAFINNEALIKKIYLPKIIFPVSISLALLVDSILSFFAFFILLMIVGGHAPLTAIFIPVAYLLLWFFTFGLALVMSVATVFYRDLQHITLILLQGMFFLTPVFYKHNDMGGSLGLLMKLNPVVPFIDLFRTSLYTGEMPAVQTILISVAVSLVSITIGVAVFIKNESNIVFRL